MRYPRSCPPGVFCLSTDLMLTLGIMILLVGAGLLYVQILLRPSAPASPAPMPSPTVVALAPSMPSMPPPSGDSRYDRAPQPLRDWRAIPELPPRGGISALPFNIPTQGLPESFQSVGVINVNDQMLPLYGRRTTGGSDRWNYYTRTDTYNPVPLPVKFQKRNCMDGIGCSEMMSGETVVVDGLQKEGKAQLYRMDGPTYLPGIV
jgi:hypothetical protein